MPLKFKLVGQAPDSKYYEINDNFEGPITLKLLNELFQFHGLNEMEISKIRFITDSEQIKNPEKQYIVRSDEERVVFVFSPDILLRTKLQQVFMNVGSQTTQNEMKKQIVHSVSPDIIKPITNNVKVEPIITPEIVDSMNKKSIELFNNMEFKSLLNVYLKNPSMFGVFSKFVQHGDIVPLDSQNPEHYDEDEYSKLVDKLEELNTGLSRDELLKRLIKYSGHLNLTLRSILMQ
jgi:hypothetical protein